VDCVFTYGAKDTCNTDCRTSVDTQTPSRGKGNACPTEGQKCNGGDGSCQVKVVSVYVLSLESQLSNEAVQTMETDMKNSMESLFTEASKIGVSITAKQSRRRTQLAFNYDAEITLEYVDTTTAESAITIDPVSLTTSIESAAKKSSGQVVSAAVQSPLRIRQDEICEWSACVCPGGNQVVSLLTPSSEDGVSCDPPVASPRPCYCPPTEGNDSTDIYIFIGVAALLVLVVIGGICCYLKNRKRVTRQESLALNNMDVVPIQPAFQEY